MTLKLKKGQLLYKQGDAVMQRSYIVLAGKILLKGFLGSSERFDNIGSVEAGDTLGEEGILEVESAQRKESAYAE